MVAWIVDVLVAVRLAAPAPVTLLASIWALTLVRMTLVASAPAPLTAMPACPPMPAASEAAVDVAVMLAFSTAFRPTAPVVVTRLAAFLIAASTTLAMVFSANETAMDSDTPPLPPNEAATLAAPALALIVELSWALRLALAAVTPAAPVPLM